MLLGEGFTLCCSGDQRVALRNGGALYWLLGDHLGSMAYTLSAASEFGEVRYKAFGATRFTSGTTPTTFRYTGQREESALGLYYYAPRGPPRWYDPALGHFIQPDTMVPDGTNAADFHRYGYTRFNPLKYTDPTGHFNLVAQRQFDAVGGGGGALIIGLTIALASEAAKHSADFPAISPPSWGESFPLTLAEPQVYAQPVGADQEIVLTIPGASADSTLQIGNVLAEPLPGVDPTGHIYQASIGFIDPTEVRFSQNSVSYRFKDGGSIDDLANGLRNGSINPQDVPAIRLVEKEGVLYTLDNRRLEAFRRAGVNVPFRMATPDEIEREKWKFTTQNQGDSVRVRGPR